MYGTDGTIDATNNDMRIRDRSRAAKWNRESMKITMTVNTKDVRLDYR